MIGFSGQLEFQLGYQNGSVEVDENPRGNECSPIHFQAITEINGIRAICLNVFAEIHLPIISGVSLCILEFVSVTVRVEDFIFLQGLFCYNCIGNSIHKSIVTDITMHNSHIKDIQIKE